MIDLHTHILPGVDDGVEDFEQAKIVAESAVKQGITHLVATPHYMKGRYELEPDEIVAKCKKLEKSLNKEDINVKILPGNEVYLKQDTARDIHRGKVKAINDSHYLLVELPMGEYPKYLNDSLYDIRAMGYRPIIAHPERYRYVQANPNLVYQWNDNGIAVQMNAGSLLGLFGSTVQATAQKLLSNNLVQLIGSDLHSDRRRKENLAEGLAYIKQNCGSEKIERLKNNSLAVIEDRELSFGEFYQFEKERGVWGKLMLALGLS